MSVAFRRESDDEHLEPKFEVSIPPGPNLVTSTGMAQIRGRLADLEAQVTRLVEDAELAPVKRDLRYWSARLATAEEQPVPDGDIVRFGSRVKFSLAGKTREITIVGHDEADPARNLLSFTSPLAQALLGAEAGERLDFNGREEAVEVLEVGAPVAP